MKRIADLSVFVSVVKAGSLSEASNDLGLSVASISKYISRIEQELGVRVLVRNARGLRLTSEGQALYVRVDTLLSQLNKAIAYVSACRDVPRGMLKVSSTIGLGRNRIAPLVSEFSKLYPDVTVQLYFIPVKSANLPWVLLLISVLSGGDPYKDLIGIAAGHAYIYLKMILPDTHGYKLLETPRIFHKFVSWLEHKANGGRLPTGNVSGFFGSQG